jgi:hypothetical protein
MVTSSLMRFPPDQLGSAGASGQICKDDVNGLPPLGLLNVNPFVSSLFTGKKPRLLLELKYTSSPPSFLCSIFLV